MRLTAKLLGYLHRVFNKDPMQFLALRISTDSGQMTWSVSDGFLALIPVGGTAQPQTLDLSKFTIQGISQFLTALPGYRVTFLDPLRSGLSAMVLLDASGDIALSNGDHIFGYTNLLYSYVNANAVELDAAQEQIGNMLAQMNTIDAQGEFLDLQGTLYDVPRNPVELDPSYSPRITSSVLLPSSNNIGMAIALESHFPGTAAVVVDAITNSGIGLLYDGTATFNGTFEYNSQVTSDSGGLFDVTLTFDFDGLTAFLPFAQSVVAAVDKFRAGGTYIRNLILKNTPIANVLRTSFNVGPALVQVLDLPVNVLVITEGGENIVTEAPTSPPVIRTEFQ